MGLTRDSSSSCKIKQALFVRGEIEHNTGSRIHIVVIVVFLLGSLFHLDLLHLDQLHIPVGLPPGLPGGVVEPVTHPHIADLLRAFFI